MKACKLICNTALPLRDVAAAHTLFLNFCRQLEVLYGKDCITPNMHLHPHLPDCVFDYGPVTGFWLFSFERYNGILGEYCTNNKCIELQLMRKFMKEQFFFNLEIPDSYKERLQPLIEKVKSPEDQVMFLESHVVLNLLKLVDGAIDVANDLWFTVSSFSFSSPHTVDVFDCDELTYITEVYKLFFPDVQLAALPVCYDKYAAVQCAGEQYGSQFSRLNRSSFVLAKWASQFDGNIDVTTADIRPGIVRYFVKQTFTVNGRVCTFCFARVNWFQYHPSRFCCGERGGATPEVWCANVFDTFGPSAFVPIQRISGKFLPAYDKLANETVLYVMPLNRKCYL